jgi:hypothetical protein
MRNFAADSLQKQQNRRRGEQRKGASVPAKSLQMQARAGNEKHDGTTPVLAVNPAANAATARVADHPLRHDGAPLS